MKAAAQALIKLARDQHYVGGLIGLMCILHTWSRTLIYHPHVDCLVPAGGISSDRQQWLPARNNYLVPVEALSILFRGIFTDMVRRQLPQIRLPTSLWHKNWVVYCKPAIQGPDKVLNYLARYVMNHNSNLLPANKTNASPTFELCMPPSVHPYLKNSRYLDHPTQANMCYLCCMSTPARSMLAQNYGRYISIRSQG